VAKDEEYIMSRFVDIISMRTTFITTYEMDENQMTTFIEHVTRIERNENPNSFPDFVGEAMDVEVFNVSSSKETGKGARYYIEKNGLDKRMSEALKLSDDPEEKKKGKSYVETIEYKNNSYEFWISSLQRNIKKHKESLLQYNLNGKECTFIAHYTQKVLSYIDEKGFEQWHKIGVDRKALSLISNELNGLVDYFIVFDETNSEIELMPIKKIPSYLDRHTNNYEFYPRKDAGTIFIGVSETI